MNSLLHLEHPSSEELLRAIDHLDTSELRPFISQVLTRTARRFAPHVEKPEGELLEKIQQTLPIEAEKRYRELIARRQDELLTSAEMDELRALTHRAETLQVERLGYLAELARLRAVDPEDLMQELGLGPHPVE